MFTTDDIKKRAKEQALKEKAFSSAYKHINAAQKNLLKIGFTPDDSLIESLEKIKNKMYVS